MTRSFQTARSRFERSPRNLRRESEAFSASHSINDRHRDQLLVKMTSREAGMKDLLGIYAGKALLFRRLSECSNA
jgi:hypothetical protein